MSLQAKFITFFLGLLNAKKLVYTSFLNPPRSNKSLVTKHLLKHFHVSEFQILGKSVVTIQPKTSATKTHILFFHGGAYLLEGNNMHWKLIETLVNKTNCKVSYIDYPLAPEHNYKTTFDMVQQSFDILTKLFSDDNFVLMGDSAGAGLALAFAQKLANENAAIQPIKNILFSPWLDLSMQNPEIQKQKILDKLLPFQGLVEAAKKYAGGDDMSNYLLSPLNGKLDSLGETLIFFGTHELFYPDCKLLQEKSKNYQNLKFYEFTEMQHDWVIYPIPESKMALSIVLDLLN